MNAATLSLSWEMLARHRWMTALAAVLLLLAPWVPLAFALYAVGFGAALMVAITGHGFEAPLEVRASVFPRRLFVLPLTTWGLVWLPMLLTSTALLAVGGLMALNGSPFWPVLFAAVLAAWLQVLMWTPMPLSWLRLAPVGAIPMVVVAAAIAAENVGALQPRWEGPIQAVLWPLLALAYPAAWAGVALARRGVGISEPAVVTAATREAAPFASAMDAQLWYEGRRFLGLSVVCLVLMLVLGTMVMTGNWTVASKPGLLQELSFGAVAEAVGPGWLTAAGGLLLPLVLSLCGGMDFGRLQERKGTLEMSPFQAGKPVDDGFFLSAKFRQVTWSTLVLWSPAWLMVFAFTGAVGAWPGMAERVGHWFGSPWAGLAVVPALMAGLYVLSWLWLARGLWAGMWRSQAAMIGPVACGFLLPAGLFHGLWWLSAVGMTAEAVCMAFLARHSPRRGLIALIVVGCIAAALLRWWPVVLLAWPFAGLLLAPTAIRRNRHR